MKQYKVDKALVRKVVESNLDELSSSAGAGNYQTPFAFKKKGTGKNRAEKSAEKNGYSKPNPKNQSRSKAMDVIRMFQELSDEDIAGIINEISYKSFKAKTNATPKQKVNNAVRIMKETMKEMEKTVENVSRLKTEMDLDSSTVWKSTGRYLEELSKRLTAVSRKVQELSN